MVDTLACLKEAEIVLLTGLVSRSIMVVLGVEGLDGIME